MVNTAATLWSEPTAGWEMRATPPFRSAKAMCRGAGLRIRLVEGLRRDAPVEH
jgi:hypothetical protein